MARAIVFIAILASASLTSGLIGFSPYLFPSDSPGALRLSASLSNSTVLLNQTINVSIAETNPQAFPDVLSLNPDWAVKNLTLGVCSNLATDPFGVAVLQGRYDLGNISSGKSLLLVAPASGGFFGFCPNVTFPTPHSIRFNPGQTITTSFQFSGYYTSESLVGGATGSEVFGQHRFFASGVYTLVVGDIWGKTDFLYFNVSRIGLNQIVLCSPSCSYPAPYLSGTLAINSPSPLKSLQVFVNGTSIGVKDYDENLSSIVLQTQFESSFQSPQIVYRDTYDVSFVATFEDNLTFIASTNVIAG